jgi:hypothetical protein
MNKHQFQQGLGLILCSIGRHWYWYNSDDHRKRIKLPPFGGFECLRCGFRPDGQPSKFHKNAS